MRAKVTRDPRRFETAEPQKNDRSEFDALMATLRLQRCKRCAERVIPTQTLLEAV